MPKGLSVEQSNPGQSHWTAEFVMIEHQVACLVDALPIVLLERKLMP
jgi:hypothetical protein